MKSPTPKFFRVLRNVGLGLAAAGGVIVTTPISLPALLIAGQYLIIAGTVATAVAQSAVLDEEN